MEFNSNKSIYLQIFDRICEQVLSGELKEEDRVLSVRDYAAEMGVNPNTVARSYERLTNDGIIYNKRGIGYFVSAGAKDTVLAQLKKEFLEKEWPEVQRKISLLGIDAADLNIKQQS